MMGPGPRRGGPGRGPHRRPPPPPPRRHRRPPPPPPPMYGGYGRRPYRRGCGCFPFVLGALGALAALLAMVL